MLTWKPLTMPFKVLVSTMVLGDDLSGSSSKQTYSTYIEPALILSHKGFSGELFAGFTPFSSYYADRPSFVNIGTTIKYCLKVRKFDFPLQTKVSHNPFLKTTWYMLGVSFSLKR